MIITMMMMMMLMMIIITIPGEAVQIIIETNNSRRHITRSENNSLRDLHNSLGDTKAEINNCFFYYSFKFFPSIKTS